VYTAAYNEPGLEKSSSFIEFLFVIKLINARQIVRDYMKTFRRYASTNNPRKLKPA